MKGKRVFKILALDFGAIGTHLWLLVPFVALMVITSFSALYFGFGENLFASVLYAIFSGLVSLVVALGASKVRQANTDIEAFMRPSKAETPEQRRKEGKEKMAKMRDELIKERSTENRVGFYGKLLDIFVYCTIYAAIMWFGFKKYPDEAFLLPLPALVGLWVMVALFVPRGMIRFLLIVCTIMYWVIALTGAETVLRMLPYLVTLPMFMVMNFAMLFGPLMFFNIQQIQTIKPGEGEWGDVSLDTIRGQDEAKKQILSALRIFLADESEETLLREKGILMVGPPGVGKTLTARAIAAHLGCPIVLTTGSAFISTFMGVGIIIMVYLKWKVEGLARNSRNKRAVLFIDEAEQLLRAREGMGGGGFGQNNDAESYYAAFSYDQFGQVGDLVIDSQETLRRAWAKKYPTPVVHPIFAGAGMGMGGGNMALPVYLHWLDGVPVPPMLERIWRSKLNLVLDILFIPPFIRIRGRKVNLRVPGAKAKQNLVLHLAATNMEHLVDPAMLRPKRFGLKVRFIYPGEPERADIAELYFDEAREKKALSPEMERAEHRSEFAKVSIGLSPAQIMQVIFGAIAEQRAQVVKLKELTEDVETGKDSEWSERDKRYWEQHKDEIGTENWDKSWVTWSALLESLRTVRYGIASPTRTSTGHRETTAVHEFAGHLITLRYFAGQWHKPTALSIMPRGQALGMVAHTPVEEHDPQPQRFLEALLRVMVGSVVAERIWFNDSQPGVVSDLEAATRMSVAMVGRYGMIARKCSKEEGERFVRIGQTLFSLGAVQMNAMGQKDIVAQMLELPNPNPKLEAVYLLLGQAFVDDYRLLLKNKDLVRPVVDRLLEIDEIMGPELDALWERLGGEILPLTNTDDVEWPDELIAPKNPFYSSEGGAK